MHIEDNVNIGKYYRHIVHYLEGINLPGLPYNTARIYDYAFEDFELVDYSPHSYIAAQVAV